MLRRNDIFEMTCESFGQDAQGVCRHEGMAVFVPGLLPGERAMVRIVKPEKRYASAASKSCLPPVRTARSPSARSTGAAAAAPAST